MSPMFDTKNKKNWSQLMLFSNKLEEKDKNANLF